MNALNWILIGLVFIGMEVAFFSGSFLLWIGIGALGSSFVFWTFDIFSLDYQVIVFILFSFISLVVGKKSFKSKVISESTFSKVNLKLDSLIGKEFTLKKPIQNGRGRIRIGDVYWLLDGPDLPIGAVVKVIQIDGNILCVVPKRL